MHAMPVKPRAGETDLLELDNQLCFALHATTRRVIRTYQHALEGLDLTYPQYLVMLVLWGWERDRVAHPTVTAMGARLDLDSGTLTPLLRRLEQKGLLVRERSQEDARALCVRTTAAGRALKKRAARVPVALLEQSPLKIEEIVALRNQLQRLRAALPWHESSGAPA
jgi:DNA-binding MarR family transcriptional regulator